MASTNTNTQGSAGLVRTEIARIALPPGGMQLERGGSLPELTIAYETYGQLMDDRSNVIFVCHALSGDAHVAGYHAGDSVATAGWWDEMVGPGKGIDTAHYFVVCANILGGCKGTTGPSSINPATGYPYGSSFPHITVGDIVNAHRLLCQHLGISRLAAVIGGSFGGMQALEWAIRYPDMIEHCICIASSARLSAQALAFDIVGRRAIMYDSDWRNGDYYGSGEGPARGLALARKIGHITYLSPEMMTKKFGRERRETDARDAATSHGTLVSRFRSTFEVESYLEHQGEKFVKRFDANSYLHITHAMDEYDLIEQHGALEKAFEPLQAKVLVVALSSDWLFPPEQSIELANALLRASKQVSYCLLHAPHGHDAFLVEIEHLAEVIRAFLPWVGKEAHGSARDAVEASAQGRAAGGRATGCALHAGGRRLELDIIAGMIKPGTRVLDLGCGKGELLSELSRRCQATGVGVDITIESVIDVIDRGHNIFQGDIDAGLAMIPDGAYDYAILSETLQEVRKPRFVLREMLRVAKEGIVSFPNFGKWYHRLQLLLCGRMPKGGALPFEWYDTPNIHLFTLKDFVEVCREEGIRILDVVCVPAGAVSKALVGMGLCNLGADCVLVKVARCEPGQGGTVCSGGGCCRRVG